MGVGRENESRKADLQRRHVLDGGYNGGESHAHDADRTWHPAVFAGGSPHFLRTARARPLVVARGVQLSNVQHRAKNVHKSRLYYIATRSVVCQKIIKGWCEDM